MPRVKRLYVKYREQLKLSDFPNFHQSGSVMGMRERYYGDNALLVRCGSYVYNVTSNPEIYNDYAH